MSANIYWEKVVTASHKSLNVGAPSSFIETMRRAFNQEPWTLDENSIQVLEGMGAVCGGNDRENPYVEMIDLIRTVGPITVWSQW